MDVSFTPMNEPDARTILGWRYEEPYAVYNCPPGEVDESVRALLDPRNAYYAARDAAGDLIGYCCFGPDAQVAGGRYPADGMVDVGLGLRPDLTGNGLGPGFVSAILRFAEQELGYSRIRLTVAAFNRRAIRAYEKAGFRIASVFDRHPGGDRGAGARWVQMERLS